MKGDVDAFINSTAHPSLIGKSGLRPFFGRMAAFPAAKGVTPCASDLRAIASRPYGRMLRCGRRKLRPAQIRRKSDRLQSVRVSAPAHRQVRLAPAGRHSTALHPILLVRTLRGPARRRFEGWRAAAVARGHVPLLGERLMHLAQGFFSESRSKCGSTCLSRLSLA